MYRKAEPSEIGVWSWLLGRITGVLLVFYLFIHLWSRHFTGEFAALDAAAARLQTPFFNLTLLALVLFHGLNGIRVVLIDFGLSARAQRIVFWVLVALGAAMFLAGASVLTKFL